MRRECLQRSGKSGARGWEGSEKPDTLLRPIISIGPGLPVTWAGSASLQGADQRTGGRSHVAPAHSACFWLGPGHTPQSSDSDPLKEAFWMGGGEADSQGSGPQ